MADKLQRALERPAADIDAAAMEAVEGSGWHLGTWSHAVWVRQPIQRYRSASAKRAGE